MDIIALMEKTAPSYIRRGYLNKMCIGFITLGLRHFVMCVAEMTGQSRSDHKLTTIYIYIRGSELQNYQR